MTVGELIEALQAVTDKNAQVLIDIRPWDEGLNLSPALELADYPAVETGGGEGFVTLSICQDGATRLDPAAN